MDIILQCDYTPHEHAGTISCNVSMKVLGVGVSCVLILMS
jgi:hypothetical protein